MKHFVVLIFISVIFQETAAAKKTTTTTTTPAPKNGFINFLEDASNFQQKIRPSLISPCGIWCNLFSGVARKRRSTDLDAWLQSFNVKESEAKGVDEADINVVIEKSYGLPSPAVASLQARNIY